MSQNPEKLLARISELEAENKKLKLRKKYGLVWEQKDEDVVLQCKEKLPILVEDTEREIKTSSNKPENILIEGDNYHALSVLNYTHEDKIDVIYIDPPYNTGAKDWKYNNNYIDRNDPWRHSKWLSMMDHRLRLAKELLNKNGVLICAIDDYEVNTLGLLLEELFPALEKNIIIVEHHPQGGGSAAISRTHEFAYVLTPKTLGLEGRVVQEEDANWSLKRSGQGENNWRTHRPNQFFAIHIDEKSLSVKGIGPSLTKDEKYPTEKTDEGYLRIYPIDKNGRERVWRYNRESMQNLITLGQIECSKNLSLSVHKTSRSVTTPIFSVWKGSRFNAGTQGSNLLTEIMGEANSFPYPKSLYTVYDMISMVVGKKKNAVILDFFAGSGTTGHAVLQLNAEDNGNRRFILCTNNENNIATDVCYPRIKKIINGYNNLRGEKKIGLGGNLKYYKTDFIDAQPTDKNKKSLIDKSTEILCLKEDCFDVVKKGKNFIVLKNNQDKHLGIVYEDSGIEPFKEQMKKLGKKAVVYVFSLDDSSREEEFEDIEELLELRPIPTAILNVYKRIFK